MFRKLIDGWKLTEHEIMTNIKALGKDMRKVTDELTNAFNKHNDPNDDFRFKVSRQQYARSIFKKFRDKNKIE